MKLSLLPQAFVGCFIIIGVVIAHMYGFTSYLSLGVLQENMHRLHALVELHYWYAVVLYLLSYITASCLALPGSTFFIIAAGFLFGIVPGICFALMGLVSGATLLFLLSRYVLGTWLQQRYKEKFFAFNMAIASDGYYYMLLARMLAIFPFGMLNILAGMTLLPVATFMWTTALGMLPYIVLYSFAGQQLTDVPSTYSILSSPMLILCSTFFVRLSIVPLVLRSILKPRS